MRAVITIFFLFCFFPYLDIFGLGTDTQPNALLIGAVLLLGIKDVKINTPLILLWVLFLLSILLIFKNNLSFVQYLKNTFNYLGPALVGTATYVILTKFDYRITFRFFLIVNLIYLFAAFMQMYVDGDFGSILINQSRGIKLHGRGVISLTPEPAFYGSLCLFFLSFSLINFSKKENLLLVPLILIQLLVFSQSATGLAIFSISLVAFTIIQICRLKIGYILYASLLLTILIPVYNSQIEKLEETRMGKIVADFVQDPLKICKVDASVGVRFSGAVTPYLAAKHHYMMPMGLGYYKEFLRNLYTQGKYRSFLNKEIVHEQDKLGGGINTALFQLGFAGILLPIAIFLIYWRRLQQDNYLYSMVLMCCLLFTQIQMIHAMIGFTFGYVLYKTRTEKDSNQNPEFLSE